MCATSGCPNFTTGESRCLAHKRKPWEGSRGQTAPDVSRKEWEALRNAVLARDGFVCVRCGAPAHEVDHIVPVFEDGPSEMENLQLLCPTHHREKTAKEAARARGVTTDGT